MHAVVSYLCYNFIYWKWIGSVASPLAGMGAIFFGILPDLDGIYYSIKNKNTVHATEFQHHLNSWFHWPICWSPLIVLFLIALIFNFYPEFFILPMLGVYLHLIFDSASCGDGMMWGHGFTKEKFGKYINLFSEKTDGYHGNYWAVRYRTTIFFKIENILAVLSIMLIVYIMYTTRIFIISGFLSLFGIILFLSEGFFPLDKKYHNEPPEGRYADYRKNEQYLKWMKEKGYEFNSKYQPVRKKKN
jgi:hypothetical protein